MSSDVLDYDDLPLNLLAAARLAVAVPGPPKEKGYKIKLGSAAFRNVGTNPGTVAAGDDPRFSLLGTSFVLSFASANILGGIKVGTGLVAEGDGTVHVDGKTLFALDDAGAIQAADGLLISRMNGGQETSLRTSPASLLNAPVVTVPDTGGTITLDLSGPSTKFLCALTGTNRTVVLANVTGRTEFSLKLVQGSGGNMVVSTWPASINWGAAGAPTLSTAAGTADIITALSFGDGVFDAVCAKGF